MDDSAPNLELIAGSWGMDSLSVDSNMLNGLESRIRIQRVVTHDAQVISGLNQDRQSIGHCLILVALVLLSCLRGCGLALSLSGELGSMLNTLMKQSSAGTNWMADLQLSPHFCYSDPSQSWPQIQDIDCIYSVTRIRKIVLGLALSLSTALQTVRLCTDLFCAGQSEA